MRKLFRTFEREEREFRFFTLQILHIEGRKWKQHEVEFQWQASHDKDASLNETRWTEWYAMGVSMYKLDYGELKFAMKIGELLHKNDLFGFGVNPKQVINFLMSKGYQKGIYIGETMEWLTPLEIVEGLQMYELHLDGRLWGQFAGTYENCDKIAQEMTSSDYQLKSTDKYLYDKYKNQI